MLKKIKVIGFDADDTLWVNEPFYQDVENEFCLIMKPYMIDKEASEELFKTEMQNLEIYGYGAKGFILAMIETAIRVTSSQISATELNQIIDIGKSLLTMPIQLIDGVEEVLQQLQGQYKLILATKGDLLDQERKLERSGLFRYFHHIEIMSDKHENNYKKLLHLLDIEAHQFLMVGNSVKSDILPVINIGAKAIHVPFEVTWQHENNHALPDSKTFITVSEISEILTLL
ncbi:MAG TPA: HAD family hydrolase [Prolixibacteraceae bacterium]|jgi:putative hydrolase of the HAD superfamily